MSSYIYKFLFIIGELLLIELDIFKDLYWLIRLNLNCSWGEITCDLLVLPVSCKDLFQ